MALLCVSMLVVSSRSVWIRCSWRMLNEQPRRLDLGWYFSIGRKVSASIQSSKEASKSTSIWLVYAWKISSCLLQGVNPVPTDIYPLASPCCVCHKECFCGLWDCLQGPKSLLLHISQTAIRGCAFRSQPSQAGLRPRMIPIPLP